MENFKWLIGIAITVICGLIGVVYTSMNSKTDSLDKKIEEQERDLKQESKNIAELKAKVEADHTWIVNIDNKLKSK